MRRQENLNAHALFAYRFFFQAEDGIRDTSVTGVQTCALPISLGDTSAIAPPRVDGGSIAKRGRRPTTADERLRAGRRAEGRSEERRVGKEWRSRWARDLYD